MIISNEPWGDIWFSKHHYATELSRWHNVFFIDPADVWRPGNLVDKTIHFETLSPSLQIIRYKNFLPYHFLKFNNRIVSKRIRKALESKGVKVDWFWTFDPQRLFDPQLFKVKKSIFHVVDKYQFKHPAEVLLHKNVNGFVIVSEEFRSQYLSYSKPQLHVPHGLSADEFILEEKPHPLPFKDFILFAGNVDLRLDYAAIHKMATFFPNEVFVFLGGIKKVEDEYFERLFIQKVLKNVIYHPPVHAKMVKYWIHQSKCCIAPMRQDVPGNLISHHKILQYMAHGKAVFSPVFSAYHSFAELLYMENDTEKQLGAMENFLSQLEDSSLYEQRIQKSKENLYDNHINTITNFIGNL